MALKWLAFFTGIAALYFGRVVLVPVFLAIFLAMLLDPMVRFLKRRIASRQTASAVVVGAFLLITVVIGWATYRAIMDIAAELPQYSERVKSALLGLSQFARNMSYSGFELFQADETIQKVQIVERYPAWTNFLLQGVGSIYEILSLVTFVPILLFYFLSDRNNLLESGNAIIGKYLYLPKLNAELPPMIRAFVVGNLVTGLFLVITQGALLYILGFHNWLPLAVITGFLNLIPLLGAPLAMLLPALQGILQFNDLFPFVVMAAGMFALHMFTSNMMLPQLVATKVNVNFGAMIIGLLFWGWIWGAMGFLLAIPMTALVKIILESNNVSYPFANLLAARPRYVIRGNNWKREKGQGRRPPLT